MIFSVKISKVIRLSVESFLIETFFANLNCNTDKGRKGGTHENTMMKAGLSCNHYMISPVTGNNSHNFRITLL